MTARIRVVQVITKLDVGGAQETVLAICRLLDADRFDLSVVCGPEVGDGGGELRTEVGRHAPVEIEPSLRRAIHPVRDVAAVIKLARRWRRDRPVIVHTHSSKAGVVGRVAAAIAGVPVRIHTVHGWSFREHQGRLEHAAYVLVERAMAKLTTTIVVVAAADRLVGIEAGIGRSEQYRVIRSGVEVDVGGDKGVSGVDGSSNRRILTVTRLAPPKDTAALLRAVARLRQRVDLDVAGEGEQLDALRQLSVELGIADRVHFLGVRRDVPDLLARACLFVLSSRSEGLPRAVLEAMASGVPVVVSRVGGVEEAVEHGRSGVLVEPGDVQELAEAIDGVLGDPDLARRLGSAGREAVRTFSDRSMVEALDGLYREVSARRTRSHRVQ